MRTRLSLDTMRDFLALLGKREDYSTSFLEDGSIQIDTWPYRAKIKESYAVYHWTVESDDDPGDRDEGFSSDPTDDVIEFIKGDIPGGSFLDKYASDPAVFLRLLTATIGAGRIKPSAAAVLLRRFAATIVASGNLATDALLSVHRKWVGHMADRMNKKGWDSEEVEDSSGLPAVEFRIGGQYHGKIMVHDMVYDYEFSVEGSPDVTESGSTNAVINEFRRWVDSDSVSEAYENAPDEIPDEDDEPTLAPGSATRTIPAGKPLGLQDTIPARAKAESEEKAEA